MRIFNIKYCRRDQTTTRHNCNYPEQVSNTWKCSNGTTFWKAFGDNAKRREEFGKVGERRPPCNSEEFGQKVECNYPEES
jgi:hypothetical protein